MAFTNPNTQTSGHLITADEWNEFVNNFKFFDVTRYLELDIAESHPALSEMTVAPIELVEASVGGYDPAWYQALFDASAVEGRQWAKPIPPEYKDSPAIEFQGYMKTATSGTIVVNGYVSSIGVGAVVTSRSFDTLNAATITVPGTAASSFMGTITLTNADSMAAKDHAIFAFARQGTASSDTATGDFVLISAAFRYGI